MASVFDGRDGILNGRDGILMIGDTYESILMMVGGGGGDDGERKRSWDCWLWHGVL